MTAEQQRLDRRLFKGELQDQSEFHGSRTAQIWAALERCESLLERNAVEGINPARIDELECALKRTQAELEELKGSNLWQFGTTIHRLSNRMPASVRRLLRRIAKAAYWLLTPHKIGARLRYRRALRKGSFAILGATTDSSRPVIPDGYFRFTPDAVPDGSGKYSFAAEPQGYVYIPPRRPERLGAELDVLRRLPQFSIVVPVFNTATDVFRSMIASVQAQWYPFWELILVDDCSTSLDAIEATRSAAGIDSRIQVITLTQNHGISDATNVGLQKASGTYIVFLDHDDELTPDCLFELAKAIDRDDADYLYSDEDKITRDGAFSEPFFKPEWSPDTLMSTMYTCHVSCVRRELLLTVGLLRKEFDGAQDWDLVLRVTERARKITHISKVLYHWRILPGSAAGTADAKPYASDAGNRARTAALKRRGLNGILKPVEGLPGWFRTIYAIQGMPKVSIVIPSKDNAPVLKRCIDSIYAETRYRNFEVIVVDNGSENRDTLTYLSGLHGKPQATVMREPIPFNWSVLNNRAAQHATGDVLLFLNDDTEVLTPEWLEEMIGYAQLKHIGSVGAKLLYPHNETIQHDGVVVFYAGPAHALRHLPRKAPGPFARNLIEFDYIGVTGACLMITREKFDTLEGFNEEFAVAYNDVDFCFRAAKRGWYNVVCQGAELFHHESLSRGSDFLDSAKFRRLTSDRKRLYRAHPDFFLFDPFHNPNLHPNGICYEIPQ